MCHDDDRTIRHGAPGEASVDISPMLLSDRVLLLRFSPYENIGEVNLSTSEAHSLH